MTDTTPNPRVKATALFNRLNGEFITVTSIPLDESKHDERYYVAREVEYLFGPEGDTIIGKLKLDTAGNFIDDFKVVPFDEQPTVITEAQMNALAAEKITSRYPLAKQINVLATAIGKLGVKVGIEKTDEFEALNEMMEYISYCLQVNKTKKEHYQNDPDVVYESDADTATRLSRSMEGGIHEVLGPRRITGGRVFS